MPNLIARIWRWLAGAVQWRLLHLFHATFMVGVSGLVRDDAGRVFLQRYRLWPVDRQWGLPTGYARKGERFEETVAREVREETGLEVKAGRLLKLTSGYRLRVEIAYAAQLTGGTLKLNAMEVIEVGWFTPQNLPGGILPAHRRLIEENADWYATGS